MDGLTKTILLVEDDPDDEVLTTRAIKKNNITNKLLVAHDGEEALKMIFGANPDDLSVPVLQPTIILLDIKLPKVDGLEVLRRIREDPRTKIQPVVILTSSKEERDVAESYTLGCNSYVRKPVNFEEFISAVSHLGIYWLLLNENPTFQ